MSKKDRDKAVFQYIAGGTEFVTGLRRYLALTGIVFPLPEQRDANGKVIKPPKT